MLRGVAVRDRPQVVTRVHVDRDDAADRSLPDRQPVEVRLIRTDPSGATGRTRPIGVRHARLVRTVER